MCPRDYTLSVDTSSWGMCSCWENGGRRSKNGKSAKCMPIIPAPTGTNDTACTINHLINMDWQSGLETALSDETAWCTRALYSSNHQVCPITYEDDEDEIETQSACDETIQFNYSALPEGLSM